MSSESTSTVTDPPALDDQTPVPIKTLTLSPFAESLLFNHNDPLTLLLPASVFDIVADPEDVELLRSDEILTLHFLSYPPLPSTNGR